MFQLLPVALPVEDPPPQEEQQQEVNEQGSDDVE